MIRFSWIAIAFVTGFGCSDVAADARAASDSDSEAQQAALELQASPNFVDARYYFTEPEQIDAWYAVTRTLRQNFDDVCGDTFCEGDYSNYESLGFRCSVNRAGTVGSCIWMFAASIDEVVPRNGQFRVQSKSWQCKMPVLRGTRATELLEKLSATGPEPIFATLPGTTQSLYDGLVGCL